MKKLIFVSFVVLSVSFGSCGNHTEKAPPNSGVPDSAANNQIVPPSAAPGNANNSSLADTTYHKKDSSKTK